MKKLTALILLLVSCFFLSAQTLGVKWSRPLGGTNIDEGNEIQKTADGGFLMCGTTSSNDKDIAGFHGYIDLWVVKTNALGAIEWQKSLGGSEVENFRKLICNPDSSALIIGTTNSINGDVTGQHGNYDVWVIKIDSKGTIIWKRCLGGTGDDEFRFASATADNGYILTGYTASNNGDFTGNHGDEDVWVIKFSSGGTIEWRKLFGGAGSERPRFIMEMNDGNFVMVGSTASSNGDVTGGHGNNDVWVIKLTAIGSIIWQKPYGGTDSDTGYRAIVSNDGSLIVLANTISVNGDVVGHSSNFDVDTWVICVSYSTGNLNWQKCIGGSLREIPVNLIKDADGMFVVASVTESTDGDGASNHGLYDILLTRLSPTGALNWSKCFGGPGDEELFDIINDSSSRGFILAGTTLKDGCDVTGYHVITPTPDTLYYPLRDAWVARVDYSGLVSWQRCIGGVQDDQVSNAKLIGGGDVILTGKTNSDDGDLKQNRGNGDAWIIKLSATNTIKGTVFIDKNVNGIKDAGEVFYSKGIVTSKTAGDSISNIPFNGIFINEVDTGTYTTTVKVSPAYYSILPVSKSSTFSTYFNTDFFSFALQPIPNKKDLNISLIPITPARPGFSTTYRLLYNNAGTTTIPSGEVVFKKDSRLSFVSSSPVVATTIGDTLKWNYTNFAPGDTASIFLNFTVATPPTVNINDTLLFTAFITPVAGDETPANDTAILKQRVIGSFDPNDKTERNEGSVPVSFITKGSNLQYLIRFQNTGTDTAFNITVRDTLSARVDAASLQMVAASHPYTLTIENGIYLTWQFKNILLPYTGINEPASHGYIVYTIRPKADVAAGETIYNTASIYFDFNLPILTNDATTRVQANLATLPQGLLSFYGSKQNDKVQLSWKVADITGIKRFSIERSSDGINYTMIGNVFAESSRMNYTFTDPSSASLPVVFYRLVMVAGDGSYKYSNVLTFRKEGDKADALVISPNPVTKQSTISFNSPKAGRAEIQVLNANGTIISKQIVDMIRGTNVYPLTKSALASGIYFLRIISGEATKTTSFVVK